VEMKKFIDTLPFSSFKEVRKAVIARAERHALEISTALEYLMSQGVLAKAVERNRQALEKVLEEKCSISTEIAIAVVDRYIEMKEHYTQDSRTDKPYDK